MTAGQPTASSGDAIRSLFDSAAGLLRQELRRGEAEMKEKARAGSKGAVLLGAAGVCGGAAVGTAAVTLIRLLDRFLGPGMSAFAATACLSAAAAVFAGWGIRELRPALPLLPTDTLDGLAADLHASESSAESTAKVS